MGRTIVDPCRKKKRYLSKEMAQDFAMAQQRVESLPYIMEAYKCKDCHFWHLGHSSRWQKDENERSKKRAQGTRKEDWLRLRHKKRWR